MSVGTSAQFTVLQTAIRILGEDYGEGTHHSAEHCLIAAWLGIAALVTLRATTGDWLWNVSPH